MTAPTSSPPLSLSELARLDGECASGPWPAPWQAGPTGLLLDAVGFAIDDGEGRFDPKVLALIAYLRTHLPEIRERLERAEEMSVALAELREAAAEHYANRNIVPGAERVRRAAVTRPRFEAALGQPIAQLRAHPAPPTISHCALCVHAEEGPHADTGGAYCHHEDKLCSSDPSIDLGAAPPLDCPLRRRAGGE